MLTLDIRDDIHPTIKQLLTDYRRVQISRFPVIVRQPPQNTEKVVFIDSRFPTNTFRRDVFGVIAQLGFDGTTDRKGRLAIGLYSRLITNQKYSRQNVNFHMHYTSDPKKMLGFMRQFALPYTAPELIKEMDIPDDDHERWIDVPRSEFREISSKVRDSVLAKEIMYLQSIGVEFQSNEFREIAARGIELHQEAARRKQIQNVFMLAIIQPDQSLLVSWPRDKDRPVGSRVYEHLIQAPQNIQQPIAMLRLCEMGTFVPEVGVMKSENTFWVMVNPNEFNFSNS